MHGDSHVAVPAPPLVHLAMESLAIGELGLFGAALPLLLAAPRPIERRPVLVLPGFSASDRSTIVLRRYLHALGHDVYGWDQGRNWWRMPDLVEGVPRRLREIHQSTGKTVDLVGWSAGGMWSRELAREYPDAVRQVITMGSPFRVRNGDDTHASFLFNALKHRMVPEPDSWLVPEEDRPAVPCPTTAIYTRTDGIAHWTTCIEARGPQRENIEVAATHCGLGVNPAVAYVVADRLAQPVDTWRRFRAPAHLRWWYRKPTYWPLADAPSSRSA